MKQNQVAVSTRRGGTKRIRNPGAALSFFSTRPLAVWAILAHCLTLLDAAEVVAARKPDSQPIQAQQSPYTPQGRQMERYKAFARQAKLPPITVTGDIVLEVGGLVKLDVTRLGQLPSPEQGTLAEQFGVPVGVIEKLVRRVASGSPPAASQVAEQLRQAVVDYRFLQVEWDRYHPPSGGQATKSEALAALQTGDITQAWRLYDGLRKPQAPAIGAPAPPGNLRVVPGP